MPLPILRLLGERVLHKTVTEHTQVGKVMDIKLGFAMLKDKRVPFRSKLLSLGIGAGLIALLIGLEIPLEWFLAIVLPVIGLVADALTNAMEAIIGTLGVAALVLPHVAPKLLTMQVRNERAGIIEELQPMILPAPAPMPSTYDIPQSSGVVLTPKL